MIDDTRPEPFHNDSTLFPSAKERRKWDNNLSDMLFAAEQHVIDGPVAPLRVKAELPSGLDEFDFQTPIELGKLLKWTVATLEKGLVHLTHPRYLGLFNPAPTFPAQCADRIAAAFNPQLASAATSPAAVEIEAHVTRALANRAGLGAGAGGHFTSGGSEANGTAILCALTRIVPGFAASGSRAFIGPPVFYISQDSHLAWIKLAHQAGIGRDAARQIPTDGRGVMSMKALETTIREDKAQGRVPFMIAATAGTTNAGMVDPLYECAEIARREGLWYHVDAAWGGAVIASPRLRHQVTGIDAADSVTMDGHKWFCTTMGCGIFLTPHLQFLTTVFDVQTNFMPSHTPGFDPYLMTAQWSRRFSGLRLFLSLAAGGWEAHATHVERCVSLAMIFAASISSRGWRVLNTPGLAVVCAAPPDNDVPVSKIVGRVIDSGRAWVSVAKFEGQEAVRVCITNGRTTQDDIIEVISALEQARLGDLPAAKSLQAMAL